MTAHAWFDGSLRNTFTFSFYTTPHPPFHFSPQPSIAKSRPPKRRRPLWDVDGSTALGKKKRRLRLNLITSKLSKPFSSPASNVADHGVKKVTVFRGKGCMVVEKGDLRKTALTNCVRRRVEDMRAGTARARALFSPPAPPLPTHAQLMCQTALRDILLVKPPSVDVAPPLPPSPLGQSNYDALDLEDEAEYGRMYGSDGDGDGDGDGSSGVGGTEAGTPRSSVEGENYEFLDEMDGIAHDGAEAQFEYQARRWWG